MKKGQIQYRTRLQKVLSEIIWLKGKMETIIKEQGKYDPLDDIFVTDRELKLTKEIKKLQKEIKEKESVNEHLRRIYKKDIK